MIQDEKTCILEYYAYTNGATYRTTAEHFDKSFSSIAYLLRNPPSYISDNLTKALEEKKLQNLDKRAERGGEKKYSNKTDSMPENIAEIICETYLKDGVRTRQLVRLCKATQRKVREVLENPPEEYRDEVLKKRMRHMKKEPTE